jgi:glycosyltransferase involved in cell wall biosynthesis
VSGDAAAGAPRFSVVVTTYNREAIVRRCVESCLDQTFSDFEVVVVDDASTDGTLAALRAHRDPRLRVVAHERNRGINPARHSGVAAAGGEWVVVLDSDWELLPDSLERLAGVIDDLPPEIHVVRSQLAWDDGHVTPSPMPRGPVGYEERIAWIERDGPQDAGRCIRRSAFELTPYIADRRGAMEWLFELDLARNETAMCVPEVLGLEHTDAANSWLRSADARDLLPRLREEAPDMLWMAETALARHGAALRAHGPGQYANTLRVAAMQAFLLARRRAGARYSVAALRVRPFGLTIWATLILGLAGPGWMARGVLALRRLRDR